MLLAFLNIFFFIFHSVLIVFNLFGWMWKKTRKCNLITLAVTLFSWSVLGIWYGFGYCPCTEWHWQVRFNLGFYDMPSSYIKFLIDSMTGLDVNTIWVDYVTLIGLILAIVGSLTTNFLDWRKSK
ncbi:DUF2784 family protein [candidate division KSB1 bacterium]|nr:DUF2784 family protein [candidate division KSB1 bacterium]